MNFLRVPKGFLPSGLFSDHIFSEFVSGSAIGPDLFGSSITIVSDTEVNAGQEAAYPIHDALNWRMSRFGRQARTHLEAALFQNEDGTKRENPANTKPPSVPAPAPFSQT
jgi:hypothetical protein